MTGSRSPGPLHASLATYLTSVQLDRPRALRHAQQALPAAAAMSEFNSPIVPETISVFLFADFLEEARQAVQAWLSQVQSRGLPLASSVAASFASLVALHAGSVSESAAWARQALDASADLWASPIAVSVLILSFIERDEPQQAQDRASHARPHRRAPAHLAGQPLDMPAAACAPRPGTTGPRPTIC